MITTYDFHELADLFPLMESPAFDELVADIRANGLQQPIILLGGRILDGRNRFRACEAAGVEPKFKTYEGGDPLRFIVSANLHRRHLDTGQRAMIAARLANLHDGQRADYAAASQICKPVTQAQAAELVNVSRRSVAYAKTVQEHGSPELQKAVDAGEISPSRAAAMARPKERIEREDGEVTVQKKDSPKEMEQIEVWRMAHEPDEITRSDPVKLVERGQTTGQSLSSPKPTDSEPDSMGRMGLQPYVDAATELFGGGIDLIVENVSVEPSPDLKGRVWIIADDPSCRDRIIAKLIAELDHFEEAVLLLKSLTYSEWFQDAASRADAICFPKTESAFRTDSLLYYGPAASRFASIFSRFGLVAQPLRIKPS